MTWISVDERLPEVNEEVLWCNMDGWQIVGYRDAGSFDGTILDGGGDATHGGFHVWRPLPPVPTEDSPETVDAEMDVDKRRMATALLRLFGNATDAKGYTDDNGAQIERYLKPGISAALRTMALVEAARVPKKSQDSGPCPGWEGA